MISIPMLGAIAASRTQLSIPVPQGTVVLDCSCNGSIVDASGHHQLSPFGTIEYADGGAVFDGVVDYSATGVPTTHLSFGLGDFSISFEAKKTTNTAGGYDLVLCTDESNGNGHDGWFVELSTMRGFALVAQTGTFIFVAQPATINDGLWHKWEVRRDAGVFTLLRDDVVIRTYTHPTPYNFVAGARLGVGTNARFGINKFCGSLKNILITRPGYAG